MPHDPFDPAYKFDDLDEFVRNAQLRGMEVLITLWGTPKWANGGKTPNYLPTNMTDFQNFAQARRVPLLGQVRPATRSSASTGSGTSRTSACSSRRNSTRSGAIVGPAAYAKLAAAGYAGIKAGNRRRSSRSARHPRTAATSRKPAPPTRYRPASSRSSSQGEPAAQVRRLGAASVPVPREPEADPEGEVAERDAGVLPAVRDVTRHVVPSEEHPVWITEYGQRRSPASRGASRRPAGCAM